jgi:TetR/AcrR family transcriptional regulator, mexCD-oprJ operon repressor
MSQPLPRPSLRDRVKTAILEAAAEVLAAHGEQASMSDVAAAAGVARATVYRYFPSRQVLLDELAQLAVAEAAERLAGGGLESVPVPEAIERAVRSLVAVGDSFVVLARERVAPEPEQFEAAVGRPLARLFERGQTSGEIRDDVPARSLTEALVALVVSLLQATPMVAGEDAVAMIASIFLDGARARA